MIITYKLRNDTHFDIAKLTTELHKYLRFTPTKEVQLFSWWLDGLSFTPKKHNYNLYTTCLSKDAKVRFYRTLHNFYVQIESGNHGLDKEVMDNGGDEVDINLANNFTKIIINEALTTVCQSLYTKVDMSSTARLTDEIRFMDIEVCKLPKKAELILEVGNEKN